MAAGSRSFRAQRSEVEESRGATVRGAGGGTGIGLVEVCNLDQTVDSKLANILSRGSVQTDDNVMIGGFIISGTGSKKVIIRAIGPSLPVPGNLADPTLELYDSNGVRTAMNDDWRSDQETEIIASTVQPPNNLESAIVTTLPFSAGAQSCCSHPGLRDAAR